MIIILLRGVKVSINPINDRNFGMLSASRCFSLVSDIMYSPRYINILCINGGHCFRIYVYTGFIILLT